MRGINLGGWLVLERWMTPSLFDGLEAQDEHSFCTELGDKKHQLLKKHRDTFITRRDFKWIAEQGFEAVRLPVGYWLFESTEPFVESASYVEKALKWAADYDLKVIIDLHAAPGSQNGWAHSGRIGNADWHINADCIDQTIDVASEIAEVFGGYSSLWGIELLNEPERSISLRVLKDYYRRAYHAVRAHVDARVAVIINDAYRPIAEWEEFIYDDEFENMLLDVHLYQTFADKDKKLTIDQHITKALKWGRTLQSFGADKVIVGEWSIVLDQAYNSLEGVRRLRAQQLYMAAQEYAFIGTAGQFYWNYKTENKDLWSYKTGVLKT